MTAERLKPAVELHAQVARLERELAEAQRRGAEASAREIEAREREAEALEQQTALGDVLRVIAGSPADFGRVLEALGRAARTLGEAERVAVQLRDGDHLVTADSAGGVLGWGGTRVPITRSTFSGRALPSGQSSA